MRKSNWLVPIIAILLLAACSVPPPPAPTATPAPTVPPTATPLPTPTPTPTPLPPVPLTITWPPSVAALDEVTIRVELPGLLERDPDARVQAWVVNPDVTQRWEFSMQPLGDGIFVAEEPLQLPLQSPPGDWLLRIFVFTDAAVSGDSMLRFRPEPIPLWELEGLVRPGVTLVLPQFFAGQQTVGDEVSGGWLWSDGDGQLSLWWVPGPAEPLTEDTAQMLAEASRPEQMTATAVPVTVEGVQSLEWNGLPAVAFAERWPEGPAQALVVQGTDRWLYLLRIRALAGDEISPMLHEIQATFRVE